MEPASKQEIMKFKDRIFNPTVSTRNDMERIWYRNILYFIGEQWITWSKSQKGFVPKYRTQKAQPTPVDNIIRDHVRSMKAMILNKDFDITVWPNSNDRDDRSAAKLGEELLKDINAREDFIGKDIEEEVAMWTIITGTGFLRDYASKSKGQIINIGKEFSLRTGDVVQESLMSFNVFVDDAAGVRLRDKTAVGIQSLKTKDWIAERFPEFNKDSGGNPGMINYQRTLAQMVSQVSPLKSQGSEMVSVSDATDEDYSMYQELEFAPSLKYPKGRYVVVVGKQILHVQDRMPVKVDANGLWNYTVEDFRIIPVPGRFWGDSSINDLISPQNTINKIDQALEKNRKSLGRPYIITATGVRLKKKSSEDAAILQLEYDPVAAKGTVPTIHHGVPLPADTFNERALQKEVAQDSSGDPKGVLRGKAPSSSSSGVMVDILRETAEQGHAPDVNRFFRALQRSYRKRLILAQELYTEKRMLKVAGADGNITVKHFTGADLRGNTDVRLELTSGMATTNAGRAQVMKDLVMAGIFNEQVIPADIREELLNKMKISGFKTKQGADQKRAEEENSQAANGELDFYIEQQLVDEQGNPRPIMITNQETGQPEPVINPDSGEPEMMLDENGQPPWIPIVDDPLFDLDDHAVHAESHRQFIISPEYRQLDIEAKTVFMAHYEAHIRQIAEDMRAALAQEEQMMMKQANANRMEKAPFPEPPGSRNSRNSSSNAPAM